MIIDFHTHCYPRSLAIKVTETVQPRRWIPTPTRQVLLDTMKEAGVDLSIQLPVANRPDTVREVHAFAQSVQCAQIQSFAACHPDSPDVLDWLDEVAEAGAIGVKFHPPFQKFDPQADKYRPVYRKIGQLGLIALFHGGRARPKNQETFCTPASFAHIVDAFQGSPVILAHMGGFRIPHAERFLLADLPVYVDTALWPSVYADLSEAHLLSVMDRIGPERVLFGSDFPYTGVADCVRALRSLPLTAEERELIFSGNARRLLGQSRESSIFTSS